MNYADIETMARSLPAIADMIDREASLRERGRQYELDPSPEMQDAANRMFRAADYLREARLRRLTRCGLL